MALMGDIGGAITKGSVTSTGGLRGEAMFGVAYDGHIIKRFMGFAGKYRKILTIAMAAVMVFTFTQIAIPLVIRATIDDALEKGANNYELLRITAISFFAVITINYIANYLQLNLVAKTTERVLIDIRRAMYAHLQKVSLSFRILINYNTAILSYFNDYYRCRRLKK